jgi:hypothetical protein
MRYVLMTFVSPEHADAWLEMSADEKQADIDRTLGWFRQHAALGRIVGGEELGWPKAARTVRRKGVTDGPFVETKETLGGYYLIEARDLDHALELSKLCPAPHGGVEVRPIMDTSGM